MIEGVRREPLRVRPVPAAPMLPRGEIACRIRPLPSRRSADRRQYEFCIDNGTPDPLPAVAFSVPSGSATRASSHAFLVPPYSALAVEVDFAAPRRGFAADVFAEVQLDDVRFRVDADRAPARPRFGGRAAAAAAVALLVAGLGLGYGTARPRVLALAAPASVSGGTPFSVAYALRGADEAEYTVQTPDGSEVRHGVLDPHAGAFTLEVPKATLSSGFDVRLKARGTFGSDARSVHLVQVPEPALRPAPRPVPVRIEALRLASDTVAGGEPIVVAYRANAEAGTVRLIDEQGTVRAEALLNRHGRSLLVAPHVDADQDLRIVVAAQRGSTRGEAGVPVRITRKAPPSPPPADAGKAAQNGDAVAVPAGAARGEAIHVRILRHEPGLHVALMDSFGHELESVDVAKDQESVVLPAPPESAGSHLSLLATFSKGFGQETVVRPVVLGAR